MSKQKGLSRRHIRSLRQQGVVDIETAHFTKKFEPRKIKPKTEAQEQVIESYNNKQNIFLFGSAGTGKTFLSTYLAMRDVLSGNYQKLVIVRSVVPTRDVGFLPGKLDEKVSVYEQPYQQVCADLFGRKDAYDLLKKQMKIEFLPTSFIRGTTLDNCIVLIEEVQNMTEHEISSVATRLGYNSRLLVCGDNKQSDLVKEDSGFFKLLHIFNSMKSVDLVEFTHEDIVRSGFVKEFIIASENIDASVQQETGYSTRSGESYYKREAPLQAI
tara:strand:- start:7049 stop:7858 length:810 start_codon:yes stop_codon:yes gene_type:complete